MTQTKAFMKEEIELTIIFWALMIISNIYLANYRNFLAIVWLIFAIVVFIFKLPQKKTMTQSKRNVKHECYRTENDVVRFLVSMVLMALFLIGQMKLISIWVNNHTDWMMAALLLISTFQWILMSIGFYSILKQKYARIR